MPKRKAAPKKDQPPTLMDQLAASHLVQAQTAKITELFRELDRVHERLDKLEDASRPAVEVPDFAPAESVKVPE